MKYLWFKRTLFYLFLINFIVGLDHTLNAQENNQKQFAQEKSIQKAQQLEFSIYNIQAYELFKSGQYSKAYAQAILAKEDATISNDPYQLARALSNIASTTLYLGNTEKALDLYLESLDISRKNLDIKGEESTLNNIAGIYNRLENYQEALKYYEQLPVLNGKERPNYQVAVAHIGLLNAYIETRDTGKAKQSLQILDQLFQNYDSPFIEFYYLLSSASFLKFQNKFQLVEEKLLKAEQLAVNNKFFGLQVIAQKSRAEILVEERRWDKAKPIIQKAIDSAKKQDLKSELLVLYKLFVKVAKQQQRYDEAIEKMELINQLNVDISGQKVRQLAEITKIDRQMAETEEKLQEFQQKQKILSLELEKQEKDRLLWLGLGMVLLLSVFFFVYRTNSRRAIRQQQKVNEKLTELDRVKDRILTNTSHELRTPLNGIIGLSDILLQDPDNHLSQDNLGLLKLIKSSGEQLSLVINDILEMSKLKSKDFTISSVEFNLNDLVNDVISVCSPLAEEKSIPVIYKLDQTPNNIYQDKKRLQQILFNIIGNAVKFTNKGKVTIESEVILDELRIKVIDTGVGIPQDKIDRVFEGFEQVDSSNTRDNQGSGLGLAISRDIAIAMGGKLELVSKLDQGTTVTLHLPLKRKKKL